MNHRIACSLCPYNLPGGRGVTLVRRFIVFNFCWSCYRHRRKECEAFMDKQTAPVVKPTGFKRQQLITLATSLIVVAVLLLANGCALRGTNSRQAQPFVLRHCAVTNDGGGLIRCDCKNPLIAWDAQSQRKVVYCDGKIQ